MKQIVLTEQDIHALVEDTLKIYLLNEGINEISWAGLKGGVQNTWNGAFGTNTDGKRNFNFNVGQTFRSGRDASTFNSYVTQAERAINGMIQIANNTRNQNLAKDLTDIIQNLNGVSGEFQSQAQKIAAGNRKNLGRVNNPWQQQRMQQDNQYADMLNNQQTDYQNQLQDWQNKYNRLDKRFKNFKAKNPVNQNTTPKRTVNTKAALEKAQENLNKKRRQFRVPSENMKIGNG